MWQGRWIDEPPDDPGDSEEFEPDDFEYEPDEEVDEDGCAIEYEEEDLCDEPDEYPETSEWSGDALADLLAPLPDDPLATAPYEVRRAAVMRRYNIVEKADVTG